MAWKPNFKKPVVPSVGPSPAQVPAVAVSKKGAVTIRKPKTAMRKDVVPPARMS